MTISGEYSQLLTGLYAATASVVEWRSMAPRIAGFIGAHSCQIGVWSPTPGMGRRLSWTENYTAPLNEAYNAKYHSEDPWVAWVRKIQPGSLVTGDVASIAPRFTRTELYNEYCRPLGIYHVVGAGISRMAEGSHGIIGLHKERQAGTFTAKQLNRLRALVPHLQQALLLKERFGRAKFENDASFTALESLRMGVIIADARGALLFADSIAESILAQHPQLSVRNGRLHVADAGLNTLLGKFVADAACGGADLGPGEGGLLTLHEDPQRKLWLRVCPLPRERFADVVRGPAAIVFLRRQDSRWISLQGPLMETYRLTRAESRLAEALVNGRTLAEFAADAGVSVNTAKTLGKRIFAKTGHHSRAQLIRDVLSSPFPPERPVK